MTQLARARLLLQFPSLTHLYLAKRGERGVREYYGIYDYSMGAERKGNLAMLAEAEPGWAQANSESAIQLAKSLERMRGLSCVEVIEDSYEKLKRNAEAPESVTIPNVKIIPVLLRAIDDAPLEINEEAIAEANSVKESVGNQDETVEDIDVDAGEGNDDIVIDDNQGSDDSTGGMDDREGDENAVGVLDSGSGTGGLVPAFLLRNHNDRQAKMFCWVAGEWVPVYQQ